MTDFLEELGSGDRRRQLTALRDTLAEALYDLRTSIKAHEGLCRRCGGSLSEAGLASLAQRLMQVLDALEQLPDPESEKSVLEKSRDILAQYSDGLAGAADSAPAELGTKHAERRQGGRRTRGGGGAQA